MFNKVLVANRGEIAVRVIRACRELGIRSVAVFSEADRDGKHVQMADEAWLISGQPARAYLDGAQLIELARRSAAQAVHPGYGFLSENAGFAQAVADAGLVFIGPKPNVIARMGSKVESRRSMEAAGVPVVPGTIEPVSDVETVRALGSKYGYPLAIKASAGGGGRGLRVVRGDGEVEAALAGAQREGASYFNDSQVYVEKYLDRPRHIEVQILADHHGNVVHLFERDCSSQRRHQKLLEESPATNLPAGLRQRLLEAAVRGARSLAYTSAGTIECLVYGDDFYFLEVNTRVQVEHPVTEFVTGIDIVKEQIRIAAGEPLSFQQSDVSVRGHAIECRINAEDPGKNFMPSPGTISHYREPSMPWVRVDSACYPGYQVLPFYDSLLAKLVVWGRDREECLARLRLALTDFQIEGVATTIPFHLLLVDDPAFRKGEIYTSFVESEMKGAYMALNKQCAGPGQPLPPAPRVRQEPRLFEVEVDRRHFTVSVAELAASQEGPPRAAARKSPRVAGSEPRNGNTPGEIRASMHGMVKSLLVEEGATVAAGQKLIIFEAMKMESEIVADRPGQVALKVKQGDTVEEATLLALIAD